MNHSQGHHKKSGSGFGYFLAGALGIAAGFIATKIILDDDKEKEEKERQKAYEQQRAYEQRRASQGGYYQGSNSNYSQQNQQYVGYDRDGNYYHPSQHLPQQQNSQQSVPQNGYQAYDRTSYVPPSGDSFHANNPISVSNNYNRSDSGVSNASNPSQPNNANVNTRMDDCEDIICPITLEVMCRPMISKQCGHSFEKEAIIDWLNSRNTCPKCNAQLGKADLIENYSLKNTIAFMRQQTWNAQNNNNQVANS